MRSLLCGLLILFCLLVLGCSRENPSHFLYKENVANQGADVDVHIDFLEKRLKTRPEAFLEQAELAGYYLQKARAKGDSEALAKAKHWVEISNKVFENPAALMVGADIAQMEHHFVESLAIIEKVLKTEPVNISARLLAIKVLLAQGQPEAAAEHAQMLPDHPLAGLFLVRARLQVALGDADAARQYFEKALATERHTSSARESAMLRAVWARFEMEQGDLERAKQLLDSAQPIKVSLPLLDLQRGDLAVKQGRLEEGAEIFRDGFALHHDALFLLRLAKVQSALDQGARAKETLESAVQVMGKNPLGHERDLAEALLELDAEGNKENIKALIGLELKRRQDKETLRIKALVEKKFGSL